MLAPDKTALEESQKMRQKGNTMSKYYRKIEKDIPWGDGTTIVQSDYIPIEVDDWHPASDPPKPEDFLPLGKIQVFLDDGEIRDVCHATSRFALTKGVTDWRKITPPCQG